MKFEAGDFTGVQCEGTDVDYPTAWKIARSVPFDEHHLRCSYRTQSGGMLCDCHVLYQEQLTKLEPHAAGYVAALCATVARLKALLTLAALALLAGCASEFDSASAPLGGGSATYDYRLVLGSRWWRTGPGGYEFKVYCADRDYALRVKRRSDATVYVSCEPMPLHDGGVE
jgi:hypothetical protein